ncbi:MAG: hypothetical protein R3E10_14355 [Gemmatimonadota bacterium]
MTRRLGTALALGPLLALAAPLRAQERAEVGVQAGIAQSRQLWDAPYQTDRISGLVMGAFADVRLPAPSLSLLGGMALVRRGTEVWNAQTDPDRTGSGTLEVDYLSVSLHFKARVQVGPASAFLLAGPTLEQFLRANRTATLNTLLERETGTVLAATAGTGLAFEVGRSTRVGLEARVTEGLNSAFDGVAGSVTNRSWEVLLRVGRIVR